MGCDIHLKLEMRQKGQTEWQSCRLTRNCWGWRVYGMFAKLANVRNYWDLKCIEQRGFPNDACTDTKLSYCYEIKSDEDYEKNEDMYDRWEQNIINESKANEWVEGNLSEEMKIERYPYSNYRYITDPDAHSANWCTTDEMEQCIREIFYNEEKKQWQDSFVEWFALLGAMKGIETDGLYECRAVFWFDN